MVCGSALLVLAGSLLAGAPITAVAFSRDGTHLVLGSQNGLEVRSWPDLNVTFRIEVDLSHVHDLTFSPDGNVLLAAGGSPADEGAVQVLAWPSGKTIRRVADSPDLIYRVAWSPDGSRWATAGADATCAIYEADSGQRRIRYEGHSRAVLAITFLYDGKTAISAGADQSLQLWEVETGRRIRTLDNPVASVVDVGVRPKQAEGVLPIVVSISEDRTVRLWQPTIGRLMRFIRLSSAPQAVAWTPEGDRLLVECQDGRLRVIDPETLEILSESEPASGRIQAMAASPTPNVAVVAGGAGAEKVAW